MCILCATMYCVTNGDLLRMDMILMKANFTSFVVPGFRAMSPASKLNQNLAGKLFVVICIRVECRCHTFIL